MAWWALCLIVALLSTACDRGATAPTTLVDPRNQNRLIASETDLAGQWRITNISLGGSYNDDFSSSVEDSPISLTFAGGRLTLETPCRVCEASRDVLDIGMSLGSWQCQPRACAPDADGEYGGDAAVSCLRGNVSATLLVRAAGHAKAVWLNSSNGYIDLER